MRKSKLFIFVIFLTNLSYLPNLAQGWGVLGHRIVAQIAENHLSAGSKKAIKKILGTETMAMTANWADFIKSDTAYNYLDPCHYINFPEGLSKAEVKAYLDKYPAANIYSKTIEMIEVLKNAKSTASQKKFAMRMLIHLIGDMHQPMHTARKADMGGNRIIVRWFGKRSNLHQVWDSDLINFQQLSYTEYAAALNHGTPAQITELNKADFKDIIYESYSICNMIYASGIKTGDKLSFKYNFDWIEILNSQLYKGGIRLANILNDIYG